MPGAIEYAGIELDDEYDFLDAKFVPPEQGKIEAQIIFRRNFVYHAVSTFIPTICLLIIAEVILFIDESYFETIIMVALTTMLVMYTLFQSISVSLPQTGYIKLIDVWFLHALFVPFFVFMMKVISQFLRSEPKPPVALYEPPLNSDHSIIKEKARRYIRPKSTVHVAESANEMEKSDTVLSGKDIYANLSRWCPTNSQKQKCMMTGFRLFAPIVSFVFLCAFFI